MIAAFIGLGSNLQQPILQLRSALAALELIPESRVSRVSSVYRSAAVGPGDQPDYLNAAVQLDTSLEAPALLQRLQAIEQSQGRQRTVRWGARTLDLDILLYGDSIVATDTLSIPHPALPQRNFVLYPLAEIAGVNLVLPDGTDLGTLISRCPQGEPAKTGQRLKPQDATVPGDVE
jgi:2-amino-4-hydroxy-6-hydroxymethyldihydropteridine diphosphokinase